MTNPVDEYLKTAGWLSDAALGAKETLSGQFIGRSAAAGGVAALAVGGTVAANRIMSAISKKREFESMMQHDPGLADEQSKNSKLFNSHYNSFRAMNPLFAKDPVVSAQYMRQMSEFPGNAGKIIVESLQDVPKSNRGLDVGFDANGAKMSLRG